MTEDRRNLVEGNRLWDDTGREWTSKHAAWVDRKTAARFCSRGQRIALFDYRKQLSWLSGEDAKTFWSRIADHFEVPGDHKGRVKPDEQGQVYAAHVWRSGDERLIAIEIHC